MLSFINKVTTGTESLVLILKSSPVMFDVLWIHNLLSMINQALLDSLSEVNQETFKNF